jgi:urea transport system substrate-binding protein
MGSARERSFYRELIAQQISANSVPVMALSVGEHELLDIGGSGLTGQLAAWNHFPSVKSAENDAFMKMWADFNIQRDKTTNDPMEATLIGFRMWAQAVSQAGTADVDAVRQATYGQRVRAQSGFEVVMNTNHHLSKPVMIGKLDAYGTFEVVWRSISPIKASAWSRYLPESAKRIADWTFPCLRRVYRADLQRSVIVSFRSDVTGREALGYRCTSPVDHGANYS